MTDLSIARRERIYSIDVLHGITIFLMLFVNDLGWVNGVPWWMRHSPSNDDGITFVDLVFPAFLFVIGMSIPIAFLTLRFEPGRNTPPRPSPGHATAGKACHRRYR